MIKEDDSWMFETFCILDKYEKHPEDLTEKEKERLEDLVGKLYFFGKWT